MSKRTLLLAVAGVVAAMEGAYSLAQVPSSPLAEARLMGSPIITLDAPANDATSSFVVPRMLDAAQVRYGFEGGALPDDVPAIDFARPPLETITLTGLTLGAALDAIVRANPHVRWTEANGALFVRTTSAGQGILDQHLARFVLVDATPRVVLDTLVRALDPSRTAAGVIGMGRPAAGRAGQPPARTGKNITLALDNPTVLEVLQAASRQDSSLSWSVTYASAPETIRNATIRLIESGVVTESSPADTTQTASGVMAVIGDVVSMLTQYLRFGSVRLAIEQLPATGPPRLVNFVPALHLDGVPPREAIARIVAYDSRYEWSEANGVFHVRPKSGTAGRSNVLDRTLPSFVGTGKPARAVLHDLIGNLATQSRTSLLYAPLPSQNRAPLDAIAAAPVDVSFPGQVVARDLLDALCRAMGLGVSWVMRSSPPISGYLSTHTLQLMTADGIVVSEAFTVPVETIPTHPPAHPLPTAFTQVTVATVNVSIDQPGNPFAGLAASAEVPIGVELLPRARPDDDPRVVRRGGPAVRVGPGNLADAAYVLMERLPDYEFVASDTVLDVAPSRLLHDSSHFMNRPLGRFEVNDMPTRDVVCLLRQRMAPTAPAAGPCSLRRSDGTVVPNRLGPAGAALDRLMTLALENPTPRDVLNAIIGKHGDLTWLVTYEGRTPAEVAEPREENAVIALGAFYGGSTIAERFIAYRDPADAAAPSAPSVPALRRGLVPVMFLLPASWRSVESALQRLTAVLHVEFGVEGVIQAGASPEVVSPNADYYDLAGLSVTESLAKVAELGGGSWTEDRGVFHLRSKALAGEGALPLDRHVDHFEQQLPDARTAVQAVRALITAQPFVPGGTFSTTTSSNGAPAPPAMGHPISINLSNVTVREILDEIVRQFGDAAWFATYVNANGTYPEIQFKIASDRWSSSTTIPVR